MLATALRLKAQEHGPGLVRCHVLARSQKSEARSQKSEVRDQKSGWACPAMRFDWARCTRALLHLLWCVWCSAVRQMGRVRMCTSLGKANGPIGWVGVILSVKRET